MRENAMTDEERQEFCRYSCRYRREYKMTDVERKNLCSWLRDQEQLTCTKAADEIERLVAEVEWAAHRPTSRYRRSTKMTDEERLRNVLERCRTILSNMAEENEGGGMFIPRWPIDHEPLRADAKNLLPLIDAALAQSDAEPHDSDGVTRKDVESWMRYFDEHAEEFVAAHEAIIRRSTK
jgi:hypothetical protein